MSKFMEAFGHAKKKFGKPHKGMGFKNAKESIMARGKSADEAGAILASGARHASPFAKAMNANLKKVR